MHRLMRVCAMAADLNHAHLAANSARSFLSMWYKCHCCAASRCTGAYIANYYYKVKQASNETAAT